MVALQFLVLSVVVRIRLGQHIANNPSSLYDLKGYFVLSSECLWRIVLWIDEGDRFGFSAILSSIMSLCSPLSAWFGWGGGCSARLFCAIAGSWETKSRISYVVFLFGGFPKQKSFLYAAVRNACIDKLRRKNPIVQDISPSDLSGIISDEQARWHDLSGDSRGTLPFWENGGTPNLQGIEDFARQERRLLLPPPLCVGIKS